MTPAPDSADGAADPCPVEYRIRAEGHLDSTWSARLAGLRIESDGTATTLTGPLRDESALLGVLNALHMLRLRLTTVERLTPDVGTA